MFYQFSGAEWSAAVICAAGCADAWHGKPDCHCKQTCFWGWKQGIYLLLLCNVKICTDCSILHAACLEQFCVLQLIQFVMICVIW